MAKPVEETLLVGNTAFTIGDGKILSVSREKTHYTKDNAEFQGAINYALIQATSNHPKSLLFLINQLDPSKDSYTCNAVRTLKDCMLTDSLSRAVDTALNRMAESSVLS